jgi:GAF domain-containing protein
VEAPDLSVARRAVRLTGAREMTQSASLDRLRILVDAGIALSSELSLDTLLQRLVETAAELTGARYAALGVIDRTGRVLERFLTTGIDAETHAAIGELPRGRGLLGVLIRDATPLRLERIDADPRAVGSPRNHPPMTTFLGVPIVLRGVAFGNLYLTEKSGGPSPRTTRSSCSSLRLRQPSRSRMHVSTNRRRAGSGNSSR